MRAKEKEGRAGGREGGREGAGHTFLVVEVVDEAVGVPIEARPALALVWREEKEGGREGGRERIYFIISWRVKKRHALDK